MAKKLSTADILKAARAQAGQGGEAPAAAPEASPESAAASPAPAPQAAAEQPAAAAPAPAAPATPPTAGAPKSTKDILAAARAQSTGAAPAASASAAPKATPAKAPGGPAAAGGASSTKDILAAARAQAGGAAAPAAAKSTGDILAAARAQAGKGTAPAAPKAAGEKPAKAAVKPAAAAATAAPGTRPSVQEMLKAAREGRGAAPAAIAAVATAVKPAPAAPVIPQKPAPKKAAPADVEPRRGFLAGTAWALFGSPFRTAWTAFTATMGISGLATARFMMPNVLVEPPSKFKVGPPSDYPPASVATKWTAQYGVWVVHNEYNGKDLIYALQTVCTHLGCTPNWLEGERKFKCPCHGSGFYITGINFEGPAPRPLERMAIRLSEDGSIEVDKSRKFQQELGQWNDPASFVEVA